MPAEAGPGAHNGRSMSTADRFPGLRDGWVRLDGPAGTLPVDTAVEAVHEYLRSPAPANTGGVFEASVRTGALVEEARAAVGAVVGAEPDQVAFGASSTAHAFAFTRALARTWRRGTPPRILCTRLDHDSNVTPWVLAAADAGATVTMVPVDPRDGTLDLADVEAELRRGGVGWLAITGASNLNGVAPDVAAATTLAHEHGARIHVDGVARVPHLPVDVNGWGVDSFVTSPYKWYGPHAGVHVLARDLVLGLDPYLVRPAESSGPDRWEVGTGNYEAIAGIAAAARYLLEVPWSETVASEGALLARMEDGLRAIDGVTVHGPAAAAGRAPTTIFTLAGWSPAAVAAALAARRIAVWAGDNYACELVDALGLREGGGAVRAGIVRYTSADDVDALLAAVADLA